MVRHDILCLALAAAMVQACGDGTRDSGNRDTSCGDAGASCGEAGNAGAMAGGGASGASGMSGSAGSGQAGDGNGEAGGGGKAPECDAGCLIDDVCHSNGDISSNNVCLYCNASQSTSEWSHNDGFSCDDHNPCTEGDTCGAGECAGTPRVCDDGVACNGEESCDQSTGACVAGTTTCGTGELCDPSTDTCMVVCVGCVIDGTGYPDGTPNPANACEACDAGASSSTWSANDGASCDDGDPCTERDSCSARECSGTPRSCNDGIACNGEESCDPTSGACVAGVSTCDESQRCDLEADACVSTCSGCLIGGTCFADGEANPANDCEVCNGAISTSAWSSNDGGSCDDHDFCTVGDTCSAGQCTGTPRRCDDGVACNGDEECDAATGACVAGDTACDSGEVCDYEADACSNACSGCLIEGTCYADAQVNPTNACEVCDAAASGSAWTSRGGTSCDVCLIYVDAASGSDANDGSSWAEAYQTVQAGLDAAAALIADPVSGFGGCEVWVAAGTYLPPSTSDKTVSIQLKAGVALYGGFAGTEVSRAQRDTSANVTILSGDIGTTGSADDNSYHVVVGATGARIDGFTITAGNAQGTDQASNGGGMSNVYASPTVANCVFSGNDARTWGGAMYNLGAAPTVTNCVFSENNAATEGGAIYNFINSNPRFADCIFSHNTATEGGGIYNNGSSLTVIRSTFVENATSGRGAGMFSYSSTSVIVTDCTFSGNSTHSTTTNGRGAGMFSYQSTGVAVTGSTFSGNTADDGGGMGNYYSTASVTDCLFSGNTANVHGGGLYNAYSTPTVLGSVFSDNAADAGGGMFVNGAPDTASVTDCLFSSNQAITLGGGLYNNESELVVTNATFTGNAVPTGSGGAVHHSSASASTLKNCILWGNSASVDSEINDSTSNLGVTYSIVSGGYTGAGNLDADPLFVDAGSGDLHLGSTSPAIDAGSNGAVPDGVATDLDGAPRIVDGSDADATATVDLGAYEWQP